MYDMVLVGTWYLDLSNHSGSCCVDAEASVIF